MNNLPVRKRQRPTSTVSTTALATGLHHNIRLECTYVPPDSLKPPKRAVRKTNSRQMVTLKSSLVDNGFVRPVLVDKDNRIVAGHLVWQAARELGVALVPVVRADHLTPEQCELFRVLDNKSAELSSWDDELLQAQIRELVDLDLSGAMKLELEDTGFSTTEIDKLLDVAIVEEKEPEEEVPVVEPIPITRIGDVYQLGEHLLICGSALEGETYATLLAGERVELGLTDPPYGVKIGGHVSGLGKTRHREFVMGGAEMVGEKLTEFLAGCFTHMAAHSIDGAIHFAFMDWRHQSQMLDAGHQVFSELKNVIIWNKEPFAGMGTFYRSQYEMIFVWKHGHAPHINNFGLGETGRHRTNVWTCPPAGNFQRNQDEFLKAHPTPKPPSIYADAMRDCSKRGGIVLDPFAGSGTVCIAAEMTGRRARMIELDPIYCDLIVRRWQKHTGKTAFHIETGLSFDELADERAPEASDEEA